ncbi:prepilin-type N-terminal cleavage/methylation domain-containing protein [Variovorax sp. H27-G14]|uniref:type II secretion system protein n=1 Tax=Variovorax sp. H27-G14 TaxID=3111914 RepID=UPI0038FC5372
MKPQKLQYGFSLLEVIAALVILSFGAAAAFTWLTQTVNTMARLRVQEREQLVRIEVIEYMRALNPSARPEGAVQMMGYDFSWTSRPLRETVPALGDSRAPGIYEVSLYEVTTHVVLLATMSKPFDITMAVPGFKQVGTPRGSNPLDF